MSVSRTPWMGCVNLTTQNTAYQLSALLAAATDPPLFTSTPTAQYLSIQVDPTEGSSKVYIGNEDVSASNYGVVILATQAYPIYSMSSNLIHLDQIWLLSDASTITLGVSFITR